MKIPQGRPQNNTKGIKIRKTSKPPETPLDRKTLFTSTWGRISPQTEFIHEEQLRGQSRQKQA